MTTKSLNRILSFAAQEKAEKLVINSENNSLSCHCYLPLGEKANFRLPKRLEEELYANLRQLLRLAPDELSSGRYFKLSHPNFRLSFYLSILPSKNGEKIVIDIINQPKNNFSLGGIGLEREARNKLKKILNYPRGLIIISSPERQGRTTTLAACLQELDVNQRSVYLLGNNPEINIAGILCPGGSQEIWDKVLKHDSEVIAIDENDDDSLTNAILASATGRLVIATIKASSHQAVLQKLANLGLPSSLITANLKAIIQQRLQELKRPPKRTNQITKTRKTAGQVPERNLIGVFETVFYEKNLRHPSLQ